jgi:hypothetical protein
VRLGGCILLELAVGFTLLAGVGGGAYVGARELLAETGGGEAFAAQPVETPSWTAPPIGLEPLARPPEPRPVAVATEDAPSFGTFLGVSDELLLDPILTRPVTRVKFNRGGSSISLRLDFEGGARAAFKPDQTNLQTVPRKEIAAFRISRLIGLSSVAPAAPRAFSRADLVERMDGASKDVVPRLLAETTLDREGNLRGAVMWWIPEIKDSTIDGYPLDSVNGIVTWKKYLRVGTKVPPRSRVLVPQISNMVAFDFLISNPDRWSGSNAKSSPDGAMLYFMDHGLSFGPNPGGHGKVRVYLERVQKFSRALYAALRELDEARLREVMKADAAPYETLLTEDEIAGVMHRREVLVAYIDELIATHGRDAVLVFP